MIQSVINEYPPSYENEINNSASGMFNMFLGLGQILGPMYGATMSARYGFRVACDFVAIFCLFYAIMYYLLADGKSAFKGSKWKHTDEDEITYN